MEFAPSFKNLFTLLSFIICIGCAEIGPPPGGEVDKVKPKIISSEPANGSTLVEPGNSISISFSERITKPESKTVVYISPRQSTDPHLKWKSNKLIMTLADSFAVDQTYIISFAEGIKDLRNNPLDSGSIIAFTTGESIANGLISGKVVNENNIPQNNIVVGLYNREAFNNAPIIDSIYPTYMGITNSEGLYSFQYIPLREYVILAFSDINKNDKLDKDAEKYGLPTKQISLDSLQNSLAQIELTLIDHFESDLKIESVRQTNDNLFKIDFNNLLKTEDTPEYIIYLQSYLDSIPKYNYQFEILTETILTNSLTGYFGVVPEGNYRLSFQFSPNDTLIVFDSVRVKEIQDTEKPFIANFSPDRNSQFRDSLQLYIQFSESIDTAKITSESFYFLDPDSTLIVPTFSFINPSLCKFSNDFIRDDTYRYYLHISEFDIFDISGNKMGDSTTIREINIVNNDSLGTIQGKIVRPEYLISENNVVLTFKNVVSGSLYSYLSTDDRFELILPQGSYYLSGYLDLNNNSSRDYGNISPLLYAEPSVNYGDTLKVRARFETTDILLEFK